MNLFFELIQISLGVKDYFSRVPKGSEWQMLFVQAKRQALVGVLFTGIERIPKEQKPPQKILLQWYAYTEKVKHMNQVINQKIIHLEKIFKDKNLYYTIMKGQGVGLYYPVPSLRMPGDIDVWARPKQNIRISLHTLRWRFIEWASSLGKVEEVNYCHVHLPLFRDIEVELHFTPSRMSSWYLNKQLQNYFNDIALVQFSNIVILPGYQKNIHVPSVEFNRFYILLHIYRHLFGQGIGLRQMMDYYYVLLQPSTSESKQRTLLLFKQFRMLKFVAATMYVLQNVFGMENKYLLLPPNEKEGKFLLNELVLAGNFGIYDHRIDRKAYQSTPKRFILSLKRNMKFLRSYPQEILFDPFFRLWLYFYRKWQGWI